MPVTFSGEHEFHDLVKAVSKYIGKGKNECCPTSSGTSDFFTDNTTTVTLLGKGTASNRLRATVNISEDDGNLIEVRDDGLYVNVSGLTELFTEDTATVNLSGAGTEENPLMADVNVSAALANAITINADGLYSPIFLENGLIWGGVVVWTGTDYIYDVSPAYYMLGGIPYLSPYTQVEFDPSDPLLDRIDVVVVDNTGSVSVLTGVASDDPQPPYVDPQTQLSLSFVLVTANSTEPVVVQEWIYRENVEWTTSVSHPTITASSAVNPSVGLLSVEATNSTLNQFIRFTAPGATSLTPYNVISFRMLSKAAWANVNYGIRLQFYNGVTAVGSPVNMTNNSFGFDSSNTSTYQFIAVPLVTFGTINTTITSFVITTRTPNTITTLGYFIDEIQLQNTDLSFGDSLFFRQYGNGFGTNAVLGTRDNYPLTIITNNIERARFTTTTGKFIVGSTIDNGIAGNIQSGTIIPNNDNASSLGAPTARWNTVYSDTINAASTWRVIVNGSQRLRINSSGEVVVGTSITPDVSSTFTVYSTTKGSHPMPSMMDAEMLLIGTPTTGLMVYNTDENEPYYYDGANWVPFGGGGATYTVDNGLEPSTATNFQLGGTLLHSTTIDGVTFPLFITSTVAGGSTLTVTGNINTGNGLTVTGNAGRAIVATSTGNADAVTVASTNTTGSAFHASTTATSANLGAAGIFTRSGNSTAPDVLQLRNTTSPSAVGLGSSIAFIGLTTGVSQRQGRIRFVWSDNIQASRTSDFIIEGVNNAVAADLLTLSGNGRFRLHNYGVGNFTSGTPVYNVVVDASGNFMEGSLSGGAYLADSGLDESPAGTFILGGNPLLADTTIPTSAFSLTVLSSNATNAFRVENSADAVAGYFETENSNAVYGVANGVNGVGLYGLTNGTAGSAGAVGEAAGSGIGLSGRSQTGLAGYFLMNPTSTTGLEQIIKLTRTSTGTATNNIGVYLGFELKYNALNVSEAAQVAVRWTDVSTRTSSYELYLKNANTLARKMLVEGDGTVTLDGTPYVGNGAGYITCSNTGVLGWGAGTGSSIYTADNGITETPAGNFKLGGVLDAGATTFDGYTNDGYFTTFTLGSATSFSVYNLGTGAAFYGETEGVLGMHINSKLGKAIHATSFESNSEFRSSNATTGNVQSILQLTRSGGGAVGTGASLDFYVQHEGVSPTLANSLVSKWTDHLIVSLTSEFSIRGYNNASLETWLTLHGTGQAQLNNYGVGTFEATPIWIAGFDASGNVIEVDPADLGGGGGGGYTVLTDGAVITWDVNDGQTAEVEITGTGKELDTPTNVVAGEYYTLKIIQGDGNDTITIWPANFIWFDGSAPTLSTGAGDIDMLVAMYDGTDFYVTFSPVGVIGGTPGIDDVLAQAQTLTAGRTIAGASFTLAFSSTATVLNVIGNNTSATPAQTGILLTRNGVVGATNMGIGIETVINNASSSGVSASNVITRWSDATAGSEDAYWVVQLAQGGAAPATKFQINSDGQIVLVAGYGAGSITGTAAYMLAVDSSNNVIAVAPSTPQVGTYSTRIGLTPADSDEFYQTDVARDAPPGKYYYINGKWNYIRIAEERLHYHFQDFNSISAANTVIGDYVLTATGSIAASSPGGARFSTGSSGTGRAVIYHGSNGVSNAGWHADDGAMYVKVNLRDLTQLSTASEEFILRIGVSSQTAGSEPVDGAYIMYDRLTSVNWIMVNAQNTGGSNRTETASSVAVSTGAHTLEIFCSGTGGTTEYWVDGVSLGTISTHIPNNFVFPTIQLVKSAGTTPVTVDVDYIKSWYYLTTQRS